MAEISDINEKFPVGDSSNMKNCFSWFYNFKCADNRFMYDKF